MSFAAAAVLALALYGLIAGIIIYAIKRATE